MAIHISFCKSTSFQTVLRRLSFALRRSPDKAVHFFFKKKNNNKQNQSAMDCISVGLLLIPLLKPQQRRTLAFPCRTFLGFCSCWSTLQKKICLKKNKLLSKNRISFSVFSMLTSKRLCIWNTLKKALQSFLHLKGFRHHYQRVTKFQSKRQAMKAQ